MTIIWLKLIIGKLLAIDLWWKWSQLLSTLWHVGLGSINQIKIHIATQSHQNWSRFVLIVKMVHYKLFETNLRWFIDDCLKFSSSQNAELTSATEMWSRCFPRVQKHADYSWVQISTNLLFCTEVITKRPLIERRDDIIYWFCNWCLLNTCHNIHFQLLVTKMR